MNICDRLRQGIVTETAAQTRALAVELAAALPPDTTLALHGDMGVGKTTVCKLLADDLPNSVFVTAIGVGTCIRSA